MNKTSLPVGTWTFERPERCVEGMNDTALSDVIVLLAEAAKILRQHKLLEAKSLTADEWLTGRENGIRFEEVSEALPSEYEDFETLLSAVRRLDLSDRLPTSITLLGSTALEMPDGADTWVDDAVRLSGRTFIYISAQVSTYVDVWMPYDLRGVEQRDVFERNGPRLATALSEIAELSAVQVLDHDLTDYAQVAGFSLINHTDSLGNPISVLDS